MYIRGAEHLRGLEKQSVDSPLWKHIKHDHKEEKDDVEFEMEMTGSFKKVTSRLINEGIRIKNKDRKCLMNSEF